MREEDFTYWLEQLPFSLTELARRANVDRRTVVKADSGERISRPKAVALLRVINAELGEQLKPEDIPGLI